MDSKDEKREYTFEELLALRQEVLNKKSESMEDIEHYLKRVFKFLTPEAVIGDDADTASQRASEHLELVMKKMLHKFLGKNVAKNYDNKFSTIIDKLDEEGVSEDRTTPP